MINVQPCIDAINDVKENINNCFIKCNAKGSTYVETGKTTSELIKKINGIPASGGTSQGVVGAPFGGFTVNRNETDENYFSIDFTAIGVTWKSITIYSNTKLGFFSINKIDDGYCIVSAQSVYAWENETGVGTMIQSNGTFRASYTANGNIISFTRADYNFSVQPDTGMFNDPNVNFSMLPLQNASNTDWSLMDPEVGIPYILDLITVCV